MSVKSLHAAIDAVVPLAITGVSVGDPSDRTTWRLDFADDATPEQRAAALGFMAAFDLSAPTADDVRAEASRRMQALFGARDAGHLEMKIANASREAIRLLRIKADRSWTAAEATRAAELETADALIEAIRAASNALEPSPPADFADDRHWPAPPA